MEIGLTWNTRAGALQILLGMSVLGRLIFSNGALANENGHNSIIQEHQNCQHIIPRFIEQVMNHKTSICQEQGAFPKPGNCTVFFKCAQSGNDQGKIIQPFVEYCSVGYNFVGGICLPNTNSSDCPQYTCRIPDDTHEDGNDIESSNDDEKHVSGSSSYETASFAPQVAFPSPSSSTPSSVNTVESTTVIGDNIDSTEKAQEIHSEQLMQATEMQMQENASSSVTFSRFLLYVCSVFIAVRFVQV